MSGGYSLRRKKLAEKKKKKRRKEAELSFFFRSYLLYPNFICFILVPFVHIIVQKSIYFSIPSINLAFFMKRVLLKTRQ